MICIFKYVIFILIWYSIYNIQTETHNYLAGYRSAEGCCPYSRWWQAWRGSAKESGVACTWLYGWLLIHVRVITPEVGTRGGKARVNTWLARGTESRPPPGSRGWQRMTGHGGIGDAMEGWPIVRRLWQTSLAARRSGHIGLGRMAYSGFAPNTPAYSFPITVRTCHSVGYGKVILICPVQCMHASYCIFLSIIYQYSFSQVPILRHTSFLLVT